MEFRGAKSACSLVFQEFGGLAACDDDGFFNPVGERPIAKTRADLPECNDGREGKVLPVEEDGVSFRCEDSVWVYDVMSDKRRGKGSEYDPSTGLLKDQRDNRTRIAR